MALGSHAPGCELEPPEGASPAGTMVVSHSQGLHRGNDVISRDPTFSLFRARPAAGTR